MSVLDEDYIAIQLDLSIQHSCSYACVFIHVRPDHHIATEVPQFMPGEGPCKCRVLQNTAKNRH